MKGNEYKFPPSLYVKFVSSLPPPTPQSSVAHQVLVSVSAARSRPLWAVLLKGAFPLNKIMVFVPSPRFFAALLLILSTFVFEVASSINPPRHDVSSSLKRMVKIKLQLVQGSNTERSSYWPLWEAVSEQVAERVGPDAGRYPSG